MAAQLGDWPGGGGGGVEVVEHMPGFVGWVVGAANIVKVVAPKMAQVVVEAML